MLEFLKKIFRNEEEQAAKKVTQMSLQNLEEWLNEKSKPLMEDVQQQAAHILMKVSEELQRARFSIEALENAKLQNPNIPFKAKQYMEGNRKAYVRSVNSFLGHMEINNRDYFYLIGFCKTFDELINDLNKGTLRSYTILQEFFAHETGKIAQSLKNFDSLFGEMKSVLNNERLVAVNQAIVKIRNLKMKSRQKINFDVDSKNAEASLKIATEEKNAIIANIEKFNASEEHAKFLSLNEERKNKAKAFYEDENSILQSFSSLERPLRKYSHIAFEHEETVLDYLNKPIETLSNDKSLAILDILKNLEKALMENGIQIDGKKKEKPLEEIKKLNKEFLEQFVKKYFSFKSEMEELENKIKLSGVAEKFRNFNRELEDANLRIEKNGQEFEKLKNDAARLDDAIAKLANEIESDLRNILNEEIRVIY
ncbi:hypothetical protein HYX07_02955 [Candidatus Woesearchaeota archaeon]|nr:hypothetical protein [Candidatus Woesearchaeota archaeon]